MRTIALTLALLAMAAGGDTPAPGSPQAFASRVRTVLTRHLGLLLNGDGSVVRLKGKTAEGSEALSFYLMFEASGEPRFRKAALDLAGRVLKGMRATKFGVLPIKEKDKPGGGTITGGGPPALGAYTAGIAYVLHKEGGRDGDLRYIASVLDRYPWHEDGWWAATIDVATGEPKVPLSKPSIVNKSAAMAMAAGIVSQYVRGIDPELSARLKRKADKCLYSRIIPAQEADGFWHYSLTGNDPKDKDVLGYFMLTAKDLMTLQRFNPAYREERLNAALRKAQAFALKCIAPGAAPNGGWACPERRTAETPPRYTLPEDAKRSFQLGFILAGGAHASEGFGILSAALDHFPYGNAGQDGAHAAEPLALLLGQF